MSIKKYRDTFRHSVVFSVVFFATLGALSIGYSNYIASYPATVGAGSGLSSIQWNKIVSGLQTLDTNLSNLSFSGGSVGIGAVNPSAGKLVVSGAYPQLVLNNPSP